MEKSGANSATSMRTSSTQIFNAVEFYRAYRIQWADSGSKHTREGWANIHCPFCRGMDYHLGFHIQSGAYSCWKCGRKNQLDVIKVLTGCSREEAIEIRKQYSGRSKTYAERRRSNKEIKPETDFPKGTVPMPERHRKYLQKRKFNADDLIKVWNLKGTEMLGEYKWRIIAPIYFNGRMVSYQGRDITDKSDKKYKACSKADEAMEHQTIVYGYDLATGDTCIVVEGIADVWRLGPGAVCCFGTAFTLAQINLLASRYHKIYILFDTEPEAQKMARQMAMLLSARGVDVEQLELEEGDPGEMSQDEADNLMEELGL